MCVSPPKGVLGLPPPVHPGSGEGVSTEYRFNIKCKLGKKRLFSV